MPDKATKFLVVSALEELLQLLYERLQKADEVLGNAEMGALL
ncbi:hypothetical protein T458_18855 [Brevibacillus panacihumi W25]|uniref:Uncharacterized protein n=1 Tax=Brevibacillus panacihumi W25 TaxID=1408254 RepID=V6M6C2_9BACL|nr:hypothetical protein T458_18855 [Brevibacillus panacihumi W25]